MSNQQPQNNKQHFQLTPKTFLRGSYLFSTEDGTNYQQKNHNKLQQQLTIEDKGNIGQLKREIQSKRQEITKKKQKAKKQKQMLIAIRDTPVEPLPQPSLDNNKCERATQEQFEYFQTYISLKQKQRKFQQQENMKIEFFQKQQQRFRQNREDQQRKQISIVLEKDESSVNKLLGLNKGVGSKKKGLQVKVVIKKKQQQQQINQQKYKGDKNDNSYQKDNKQHQQNNDNQYSDRTRKVRVVEQVSND